MDERIQQLKTPEECEQMALNVQRREPELAVAARRRAVELRAMKHGGKSEVEIEILKALYAYEAALTKKNGRTTRATHTWQMFDRHGIIDGAERAVNRPTVTVGYQLLVEMGMRDLLFEAVIVRFPDYFSPAAVELSKKRLEELAKI
jgi:hypothetical protein